jgi:hypothetical protein
LIRIEEPPRPAIASQRSVAQIPVAIHHDVGYAIRDKSGQVAAALAYDHLYYDNPGLVALAHMAQPQLYAQIEYGQRPVAQACDSSQARAGSWHRDQIMPWQDPAHASCVNGEILPCHAKSQIALESARGR